MTPQAFNPATVVFDIPCPKPSVFLSTSETMLNFRLGYTVSTITSGVTNGVLQLIGSGASWISQIQVLANNQIIETIQSADLLHNFLLATTVSYTERYGALAIALGADTDTLNGHDINTGVLGTFFHSYSIPLLCCIGANTVDKLFQIGGLSNCQLQITMTNTVPVASFCTAYTAGTQPAISAPVLDQFSLSMKQIDIGDSTYAGK
jgi:hypothetical protein